MNWKSTVTLGAFGGTIAFLLATASCSIDRQRDTFAPATAIDMRQGAALIAETARLRGRLLPDAAPRASTRNPFSFAHVAATHATTRSESAEFPAALSPPDTERRPPLFTLVGLAEDRSAGDPIVTAILSSPGALQFVKQGDRVEGGYRVAAITPESVELLADDGRPLILKLK
jgi:hypothetical protein